MSLETTKQTQSKSKRKICQLISWGEKCVRAQPGQHALQLSDQITFILYTRKKCRHRQGYYQKKKKSKSCCWFKAITLTRFCQKKGHSTLYAVVITAACSSLGKIMPCNKEKANVPMLNANKELPNLFSFPILCSWQFHLCLSLHSQNSWASYQRKVTKEFNMEMESKREGESPKALWFAEFLILVLT